MKCSNCPHESMPYSALCFCCTHSNMNVTCGNNMRSLAMRSQHTQSNDIKVAEAGTALITHDWLSLERLVNLQRE